MIELRPYINVQGRSPFERWFEGLDATAQARLVTGMDRLERGNTSNIKSVGAGVMELRMDFGPGYRIYLGRDGSTLVILLGGGTKRRQQVDIQAAQELWREYKQRKRE